MRRTARGVVGVGEYHMKSLRLSSSVVTIELRDGMATVRISPKWDVAGRYEYLITGAVEDTLNELRKLAEDLLKAVKALEELVEEVGGRGWVNR
jgi:hypothetical protein